MLFLKSWLQEYIDLSGLTDSEVREVITKKSSEVEEVRYVTDYFGGKVVVGQIKNLRKHPDADRLEIFDADLGSLGIAQIVTAAPNVAEEMLVPIAMVGASLPDFVIAERKMRGELSQGMVCGKSEILLETEYSTGVWDLEQDFINSNITPVLGQSICEAFPELFPKEVLFDVKVLPNKIGVFGSYMGMALELAMILEDYELLKLPAKILLNNEEVLREVIEKLDDIEGEKVVFEDKTGITIKFSLYNLDIEEEFRLDKTFKKRMFLSGINLVGGLTDISNYLLFDLGQPTHFFSRSKMNDVSKVEVQKTDVPVEFKGLGQLKNKNLPINSNVLVDQNDRILGIPGISGGESTKMEPQDTQAIFEIANFDNEEIARSSFSLKYRSDGSKVWAGGVNQNLLLVTLLKLIEFFGIESISPVCLWDKSMGNVGSIKELYKTVEGNQVEVSIEEIADRLDSQGPEYWGNIIRDKLNVIGRYNDGVLQCEPFYSNLTSKEDVLEEVVRLIGFEGIVSEPIVSYSDYKMSHNYRSMSILKNIWVDYGFDEVILRPFVGLEKLFDQNQKLELVKAYRTDEPFLRDSLLSTLAISVSGNLKKGEKNVRIFEANKVHLHDDGVVDKVFVDGLMVENDPYVATSLVNSLLGSLSGGQVKIEPIDLDGAEIGRGFLYTKGNIEIKLIQISNKFKKKYDISLSKTVWWISSDLTAWDYKVDRNNEYFDESDYPSINRTYSVVVDQHMRLESMQQAINSLSLEDVEFHIKPIERFGTDQGDVVNFEIDFTSMNRTIDSKEVEEFESEMFEELQKLGSVTRR